MPTSGGSRSLFSIKARSSVDVRAGASGRVVAAGLRGGPLVGDPGLFESGGLRYVFATGVFPVDSLDFGIFIGFRICCNWCLYFHVF